MSTNQTIVLDNGSSSIKTGFAGQVKPSFVLPSFVGRPKNARCMVAARTDEVYVGDLAEKYRGLLRLNYPMDRGVLKDSHDLELLWNECFTRLKVRTEEHPLLITDSPLNSRENKTKLLQGAFDSFGVPAVCMMSQTVLALYASSRTTGAVLDCGEGGSRVIAVMEGYALPHSIETSDIGGQDVTKLLCQILRQQGTSLKTSSELNICRKIKETICGVCPSPIMEGLFDCGRQSEASTVSYTLPDGSMIKLGSERYKAGEVLFNPSIWGLEDAGVHELLNEAIINTDLDLRRELTSSILLAGGSTKLTGFIDRLLSDFCKLQPKDANIKIYASPERDISAFIGGSMLGVLPSFKEHLVTKEQFKEAGVSAIYRYCQNF